MGAEFVDFVDSDFEENCELSEINFDFSCDGSENDSCKTVQKERNLIHQKTTKYFKYTFKHQGNFVF